MTRSRWLLPLCALALAGIAAGMSQAQPAGPTVTPPPPTQAGVPPQEVPPGGPPVAEEPPPPEVAPPPSAKTVAPPEDKEKPAATTPVTDKPPEPLKRPRRNQAIIQALDKVTAQTVRFPVDVNKPVRWKDLVFTVKACEEQADDENQNGSFAYLEVFSQPRPTSGRSSAPARLAYRGWMYSEAPTVHPFEHPVYDVWLIACRTA